MSENIDNIIRWMDGINRCEIPDLETTDEFNSFINAFRVLEQAHRKAACYTRQIGLDDISESIMLRICEFLNCFHLVSLSETSSRLHSLCNLSAKQRTSRMNEGFYLHSSMKLLRAKEQAEGILPNCNVSIRVPLFGLEKRMEVSNCGDTEFNGVYFCTGCNGNGFQFTKPRFSDDWHTYAYSRRRTRIRNEPGSNSESEIFSSSNEGRFLRCIISKKYSNETILWYMSKEIEEENGEVKQIFSFWAKLMTIEEATPEKCIYPSQTSIQSRNGGPCWSPLSGIISPPIVEILD
jgi:hypothetical protein